MTADLFNLINEFAELIKDEVVISFTTNYKMKHKRLVGYFNFTSAKAFSTHSKKVK